ncbi:PREDICTED: amine sulfotransferase-like [Tinamus guttatus]|nr:PREDICTED: amine sulfotransferase-like [Tinamus guttatus]
MDPSRDYILHHKGCCFAGKITTPEYIDSLETFEIRDSDVFLVTFPKSGTVWTQNILSLIIHEGHRNGTENIENMDRMPWLEYNVKNMDYTSLPSPRVFATHLPYYLTPRDLRNKRARVIYVTRNPKDILVSYFHFSKIIAALEEVSDFSLFMERFLAGQVPGGKWLDHVTGWYSHAEDFNILFLTYEEMKKDLRSAVLKICDFLGRKLSEKEVESVVRQATFENMKKDPRANYEILSENLQVNKEGHFLRKGTVGDWKNIMTVAQSERVDEVLKKKMENLPINFIWDINDQV